MSVDAGTAYVEIEAKLDRLIAKLDREGHSAMSGSGKRLGSAFAGAFSAVVSVQMVKQVGDFILDVNALGTELDVLRKKTATVFEGDTASVKKWAKANASAFGLTDDSLAGLAANFGDLLKPMGFTATQAAKMSTEVVGLSGALSAWSGGTRSSAEVSQILAKAMLGERDSLKELGIAISEADVDARLFKKGQDKLTGAALEQAKALATQELIFEKSADAQKAWADGSMDAVKSQNRLKEKVAELKEDVADKLRPAFAAATAFLVDKFIPGVEKFGKAATPAFREVVEWVKRNWPEIKRVVMDVVDGIVVWVRENWPEIKKTVVETMETIKAVIAGTVDFIRTVWENFGPQIVRIITGVWQQVSGIIQGALQVIQGIMKIITGLIHGDWSLVWEGIKQVLGGVWDAIKGMVEGALNILRGIVEAGMKLVAGVFSEAWEELKSIATGALRFVVDTILGAFEWIIKGAANAFGWVPGLGPKLKEAAEAFERFRDDVNAALGGIKSVTLHFNAEASGLLANRGPGSPPVVGPPTKSVLDALATGAGGSSGNILAGVERMHGGGVVPGRGEVARVLEGGEGVLSRAEMAALTSAANRRAMADLAGDPLVGELHLHQEMDPLQVSRRLAWDFVGVG